MKIHIEMEIVPFNVPDAVYIRQEPGPRQDGFKPPQCVPLNMVDEYTLLQLCTQFTAEIYKKAGKSQPPTQG